MASNWKKPAIVLGVLAVLVVIHVALVSDSKWVEGEFSAGTGGQSVDFESMLDSIAPQDDWSGSAPERTLTTLVLASDIVAITKVTGVGDIVLIDANNLAQMFPPDRRPKHEFKTPYAFYDFLIQQPMYNIRADSFPEALVGSASIRSFELGWPRFNTHREDSSINVGDYVIVLGNYQLAGDEIENISDQRVESLGREGVQATKIIIGHWYKVNPIEGMAVGPDGEVILEDLLQGIVNAVSVRHAKDASANQGHLTFPRVGLAQTCWSPSASQRGEQLLGRQCGHGG